MKKDPKNAFLRNGIILAAAAVLISVFMPEWGAAQVIVVALVGLLAAFQFGLYFFMKNNK